MCVAGVNSYGRDNTHRPNINTERIKTRKCFVSERVCGGVTKLGFLQASNEVAAFEDGVLERTLGCDGRW